jgi:hypothetical protein
MKKVVLIALILAGCGYPNTPDGIVVVKEETAVVQGAKLVRRCKIRLSHASNFDGKTDRIHVPTELFDRIKIGDKVNEYELTKDQEASITLEQPDNTRLK